MRECCADHTTKTYTERCHTFMVPNGPKESAKSNVPRKSARESFMMNGRNKNIRERSFSAPSIRLLPSQDMGKYEEPQRRRSAPEKRLPGAGLFPLNEEGEYGTPPVRVTTPRPIPSPLTEYQKRDRKPKVYASYALGSQCAVHSSKLVQNENDRGTTPSRRSSTSSRPSSLSISRPSSRASLPESSNRSLPLDFTERHIQFSFPHLAKKVSEKRENLPNERRESITFEQKRRSSVTGDNKRRDSATDDHRRRNSVSSYHSHHEPYCELSLSERNGTNNNNVDYRNGKVDCREENVDHGNRKIGYREGKVDYKDYKVDIKGNKNNYKQHNGYNAYSAVDSVTRDVKNFTNGVKTYNAFKSNKYRSPSFKKVSTNILDSWISEDEEYEDETNENHKNNGYKQKSAGPKPGQRKISLSAIREPTFDYDTLGILGLTSLMWSHSQAKQQDFLSKSFVRKPSISSYVM